MLMSSWPFSSVCNFLSCSRMDVQHRNYVEIIIPTMLVEYEYKSLLTAK